MTILLDTQVLILAYLGEPLLKKVQALLGDPMTGRVVSTASLFEISIKSASGKLDVSKGEISRALRDFAVTILPLTAQHGYRYFSLPPHHLDPFDRMIIATALSEKLPVTSGDREFKRHAGLQIVW